MLLVGSWRRLRGRELGTTDVCVGRVQLVSSLSANEDRWTGGQ